MLSTLFAKYAIRSPKTRAIIKICNIFCLFENTHSFNLITDEAMKELEPGEIFFRLRRYEKGMTLNEVSGLIGETILPSGISRIENNQSLTIGNMQILAEFYGVKLSDIIREAEGGPAADPRISDIRSIPMLSSAGDIALIIQGATKPEWEKSRAIFPGKCSPRTFAHIVTSEAMQGNHPPYIPKGFTVVCDPLEEAVDGDIVIHLCEGEPQLRQLMIDGSVKLLKATNQNYPATPITDESIYAGKVIRIEKIF